MLSFLARRYDNNAKQGKYGQCNQTNHREDYARLSEIANRNLAPVKTAVQPEPVAVSDHSYDQKLQFGNCASMRLWDILC